MRACRACTRISNVKSKARIRAAQRMGRGPDWLRPYASKLKAGDVIEIRKAYASGLKSQAQLAKEFKVHEANISKNLHPRKLGETPVSRPQIPFNSMNPKQPPTLSEFGEQIVNQFLLRPLHGEDNSANYFTRDGWKTSAELASLVLSLVDAYRAQNRADEPAESAHR